MPPASASACLRAFVAIAIAASLTCAGETAGRCAALVGATANLNLVFADRGFCGFSIGFYEPPNWRGGQAVGERGDAAVDNPRKFRLTTSGGAVLNGEAAFALDDHGGIAVSYRFVPDHDVPLFSLHASADFAVQSLIDGRWSADGASGGFPASVGEVRMFSGPVRKLEVATADGRHLVLAFAEPTMVLIQDNRRWGPTFSLRIGPQSDQQVFRQGVPVVIAFTLTTPGGFSLDFDRPTTIAAGADWVPLQPALDIEPGSALDFAAQGFCDAPAGRNGRVIARPDGQFAFAKTPGKAQRFYGVNLCFGAQYLSHDESDRLAERFVRLGYNAVRIHHYEGELVRGQADSVTLNPEKLDQLDYLLAALGRRGLYVTTDLFVSRPIAAKELGLEGEAAKHMNFKILVPVYAPAFANWQAFAKALLDHVNPHTALRYADDPALAWLSMINEDCLGNYYGELRTLPQWIVAWNTWLTAAYHDRAGVVAAWAAELKADEDPANGNVALPPEIGGNNARTRDLLRFFSATEQSMFARMGAFLRDELHCAALTTDTNAWTNRSPLDQVARTSFGYVDDHFYVDHPQFLEKDWQLPSRCANDNPLASGATGGRSCSFTRLNDKPFTITEFNYSGPGRFRGVGGILTGALGALQGWSGIWRFAYSHGREAMFAPTRMDYFNLCGDPLNQAADRATMMLFLRGDLATAPHRVTVAMTNTELANPPSTLPWLTPRWNWLAWVTGVGSQVRGDGAMADSLALPLGWSNPAAKDKAYTIDDAALMQWCRDHGILAAGNATDPPRMVYESETGEIRIDAPRQALTFTTPRTAGGYAMAGQTIAAAKAGVTVSGITTDATVWVSALDQQPISKSRRLLVTHLTDLQNSGIRYAESARQTLLDWGRLPYLVRSGKATVGIALEQADQFAVWALSVSGKRLAEIPAQIAAGSLSFTADVAGGTPEQGAFMLYEVVRR